MIVPKIKSISSSTVDIPLEQWQPASNEDIFMILDIEMEFIEAGVSGVNIFYVPIASVEALHVRRGPTILCFERMIIVKRFIWTEIRLEIEKRVKDCARKTYEEACTALSRSFQWEYEDFE